MYTPRLRGKAGADSTSLPLSFDKKNLSADTHSQFGPGDVNLRTGLSEEVYLAFLELAQNNYGMLMSGVSALTSEMCMRAEFWNGNQKYIYNGVVILLEMMSDHTGAAAFDNARLRCGELGFENMHAIPHCIHMYLQTRFGFDMSLGANAYQLFVDAFEKGSKDFGNRAIANLYSIQMRQGEGGLDLLTRVQVATRSAELVAIAPGTLGNPIGKIHPAVVPASGIGVFFWCAE